MAPLKFKQFTGGIFQTNCYLIETPGGSVLIDAPQESDKAFAGENIALLLLTHGHFDHVADAAAIQRRHGCRIGMHPDTFPMVSEKNFFRRFGFELEVDPVKADFFCEEGKPLKELGLEFEVLHVPGHCPGSVCFHARESGILFGGDVLFAGGVGRWDLPGGDRDLLFRGIREKVFSLPEETRVFPGHGPATTVGHEKKTNPFVGENC